MIHQQLHLETPWYNNVSPFTRPAVSLFKCVHYKMVPNKRSEPKHKLVKQYISYYFQFHIYKSDIQKIPIIAPPLQK